MKPTSTTNTRSPRQVKRRRRLLLIGPLIVATLLLILLALLPGLTRTTCRFYSMAAIRSLHTVNTAQIQYISTYGRYAENLQQLGPPQDGESPSSAAPNLIPRSLAAGIHSGYVFTMVGTPVGYTVNADATYETTDPWNFFTDQTNVIRQHFGNEPASENDPKIR